MIQTSLPSEKPPENLMKLYVTCYTTINEATFFCLHALAWILNSYYNIADSAWGEVQMTHMHSKFGVIHKYSVTQAH